MVARERMPVVGEYVHIRGAGRAPRGAAVGALERCRWDAWTCMCVAHGGQLEMLQWARASGCPWTSWARNKGAYLGYVENDNVTRETSNYRKTNTHL